MLTSLIIAAAGAGSRFKQNGASKKIPSKLFAMLGGKPLLLRALSAFDPFSEIQEVLVTFPPGKERHLRRLLRGYTFRKIKLVAGGKTRAESIWNALRKTNPKNEWILVHDGARPLVSKTAIEKIFKGRGEADGVILAKKVIHTIKEVGAHGRAPLLIKQTLDRRFLFEAETPQLVRRKVLEKAYLKNKKAFGATDEASLLESLGARVKIVAHEEWNPKITTVKDLELAEAYVGADRRVRPKGEHIGSPLHQRVGLGRDTHCLVKGRKLYFGGVQIPNDKGALGHSDGDVLLHAASDAILGAIGAGDIGEWFSDKNPRFKNIASTKILLRILEEARKRGWAPTQLDSVIILERPRLAARKKRIRKNLARLLGLPEDAVSVKAKTAEGLGPEGEGLAVTCEALVTMCRGAQPCAPTPRHS